MEKEKEYLKHRLQAVEEVIDQWSLIKKERSNGEYGSYRHDTLYCEILADEHIYEVSEDKDSPLYFLRMLATTPFEPNYMSLAFYMETEGKQVFGRPKKKSKDRFRRQAILLLLEFLNFSCFFVRHLKAAGNDAVDEWTDILLATAANEFEKLFSTRNKNELLYYFWKMLGATSIEDKVTPFKSHSWRGEFVDKRKKLLSLIEADHGNFKTLMFGNIAITFGIMMISSSGEEEKRPFVEIAEVDPSQKLHNRIFFTEFNLYPTHKKK
jgi:hypothetical protein